MNDTSEPRKDPARTSGGQLLAKALEYGFDLLPWQTPEQFAVQFPPTVIMTALRESALLRAKILAQCINIPQATAVELDAETCSLLLSTALRASDADAATIHLSFDLKDRVRFLDWNALYRFLLTTDWIHTDGTGDATQKHRDFLKILFQEAVDLKVVSMADLFEAVGPRALVRNLVRSNQALLEGILADVLEKGTDGVPFSYADFEPFMEIEALVDLVVLSDLFPALERLAANAGWKSEEAEETSPVGTADEDAAPEPDENAEMVQGAGSSPMDDADDAPVPVEADMTSTNAEAASETEERPPNTAPYASGWGGTERPPPKA